MNINKLSETSKSLIQNRIGFRNNEYYNSGIVSFEEILKYEVFELGNVDILLTCRKLYNVKFDMRNKKDSIQKILDFFYSLYKTKNLYAIWLTTQNNVQRYYPGDFISKYKINKTSLVVSDLDIEGVLFIDKGIFEEI